jgi:hypothetical protein
MKFVTLRVFVTDRCKVGSGWSRNKIITLSLYVYKKDGSTYQLHITIQANVFWRSLAYRVLISTCRFHKKKSQSAKLLQRGAECGASGSICSNLVVRPARASQAYEWEILATFKSQSCYRNYSVQYLGPSWIGLRAEYDKHPSPSGYISQ